MDRMRGAMEMKFSSFLPIRDGGDIPFHRLRYFRSDERGLFYDRTSGIDCVFESVRTGVKEAGYGIEPPPIISEAIAEAKRNREIVEYNAIQRQKRKKQRWQSSKSKGLSNSQVSGGSGGGNMMINSGQNNQIIPIYCYENDQWILSSEKQDNNDADVVIERIENKLKCSISFDEILKVVSFNVLFDHFDNPTSSDHKNNEQYTMLRWLSLLNHIKNLNAHIICLQECTPKFVQLLLSQKWVQLYYYSTVSLENLSTVDPDGQLILTCFPTIKAMKHNFSKSKSVLLSELNVMGRRLIIPCVHLTSDYRGPRATLRSEQLETIIDLCRTWDNEDDDDDDEEEVDVLIIGDFNCAYEAEDIEVLTCLADYMDVWRHIWPQDPGYTFDPTTNKLAAIGVSETMKTSKRCDRMFLSSCRHWAPLSASLIDVSVTGSDRKGKDDQHFAVESSSSSSSNTEEVEKESQGAEDLCVYEGPLSDHNGLLFEFCATSTPTIVQTKQTLKNQEQEKNNDFIWQRQATASSFLLDGGAAAYENWRIAANKALDVLLQAVIRCDCGQSVIVEVGAGSASVALPFSDVDVVIIGDEINNHFEFLSLLSNSLLKSKEYSSHDDHHHTSSIRIVNASTMPCIRVNETSSLPALDIQYVCSNELLQQILNHQNKNLTLKKKNCCQLMNRKNVSEVIRQFFSEQNASCTSSSLSSSTTSTTTLSEYDEKSLEAIIDCDILLKSIITCNSKLPKTFLLNSYRKTTRCIKLFLKRRGMYGNSYGYLSGFGVSILVASYMNEVAQSWDLSNVNNKSFHIDFIYMFFDYYNSFQWNEFSVSIDGNVSRLTGSSNSSSLSSSSLSSSSTSTPMSVLTPMRHRNSCRSSNSISFEVFQRELAEAHFLFNSSSSSDLASSSLASSSLSSSSLASSSKDNVSIFLPKVKDFINSSNHFICIEITCFHNNENDKNEIDYIKLYNEGIGYLESRIISLLQSLNTLQQQNLIEYLRPWSSVFETSKGWLSPFKSNDMSPLNKNSVTSENTKTSLSSSSYIGGFVLFSLLPSSSSSSNMINIEGSLNAILTSTIQEPFSETFKHDKRLKCQSGIIDRNAIIKEHID
jgi:endonuclease/exonuclease/phosphatase family metal-dependent hydrolase